jgi:hypothetical protein
MKIPSEYVGRPSQQGMPEDFKDHEGRMAETTITSDVSRAAGKRVLVVDDNRDAARMQQVLLRMQVSRARRIHAPRVVVVKDVRAQACPRFPSWFVAT